MFHQCFFRATFILRFAVHEIIDWQYHPRHPRSPYARLAAAFSGRSSTWAECQAVPEGFKVAVGPHEKRASLRTTADSTGVAIAHDDVAVGRVRVVTHASDPGELFWLMLHTIFDSFTSRTRLLFPGDERVAVLEPTSVPFGTCPGCGPSLQVERAQTTFPGRGLRTLPSPS